MGPLGINRTSKHKKNLRGRVQGQHRCVVLTPLAIIPDVLAGGVGADYPVHGRDLEEEERKGGQDGRPRVVNTLGAEMALSTINKAFTCSMTMEDNASRLDRRVKVVVEALEIVTVL